ncbi:MAG TPA: GntP family permease, partial [Chloroflexi bacterium]|nr:GntP family permease [Chloroflexota bacterium]
MRGAFGEVGAQALLPWLFWTWRGLMRTPRRAPWLALAAVLLALLAVLMSGEAALLLPTYTQVFMKAMGGYVIQFFPLFLLGALFGKLMDDSGSARAIAHAIVDKVGSQRAILAIVLACGILTYGGVSLFVVAFAVYPIGAALFREAGIPKRLIPAAIALGSFTFTMTALPGTPAIQNAIPSPFFGTDAFAAPGLGLLGGLIMFGLGTWWLSAQQRKLMAAGEGYGHHS